MTPRENRNGRTEGEAAHTSTGAGEGTPRGPVAGTSPLDWTRGARRIIHLIHKRFFGRFA